MSTIISHIPAADDGNAPLPGVTPYSRRCAEVRAAVEAETARRGRPQAAAEAREARGRWCPLCEAVPGAACQPDPSGDHLARYLDAYTTGQLTREFMAAVLGELVVVASWRIVPDGAA